MTDGIRAQLQASLGRVYSIERELGGGGMSHVFLAEDTELHRKVVVKILPADMAGHVSVERFKREISLAAQLQHPHIVPLLSAGVADGLPYFTMPFVRGESLRERVATRGELPVNEAVHILRAVASALAFAHDAGIVHRDIKPDNVLMAGDAAMVTDFGVAKALTSEGTSRRGDSTLTSMGIALGTPAYMSPEQASASPNVDRRADIYAWGVLAYELLTGSSPFAGRSPQEQLAAHVIEAPEQIAKRRPALPAGLSTLVMRCLAKRPADRPQSATELIHALDALTAPSGESQLARTASSVMARTVRRHWRSTLAAAALIALAATSWKLYGSRRVTQGDGPTSVAVLPFENVSGDTAVEYLSDGLSDGLRSALHDIGVRVAASTSSDSYKGKTINVRDVARTLGVASVLTGRVQHLGSRLSVSVELVSPDGFGLWRKRIDAQAADMLSVEDGILGELTGALRATLQRDVRPLQPHRPNVEAYDLYMRARHAQQSLSMDGLDRAVKLFQAAIARDSLYAQAWVGVAYAYENMADGYRPPKEVIPLALASVRRALTIDDRSGSAHYIYGTLLEEYQQDFAGAQREYLRAIELDPLNGESHFILGSHWIIIGDRDRGLDEVRLGVRLDPLSAITQHLAVLVYAGADLPDTAIAQHARALEVAPGLVYLEAWVGFAYRIENRLQDALRVDRAASDSVGHPTLGLITDLARLGRRDEARRMAVDLEMRSKSGTQYIVPEFLALAWLELGEVDRAMGWFEKGLDMNSGLVMFMPLMRSMYAFPLENPRFQRYMNHSHIQPYMRPPHNAVRALRSRRPSDVGGGSQ